MKRILIVIIISVCSAFLSPGQTNIIELQKKYTSKIEKYLDKEKKLNTQYLINDSGIYIYPPATTKALPPELTVPWNKTNECIIALQNCNYDTLLLKIKNGEKLHQTNCTAKKAGYEADANKKLNGVKIAIDPGHIAGDLKTGMLEKKFLNFNYNNKQIEIIEGLLTLHTALLLKNMLEQEGAEVMLTREQPNQTAFGITYKQWLEKHFKASVDSSYKLLEITDKEKTFLLTKATEREVFRTYFNNIDMKERVRKINAFAPDITLVIHYNVDEQNTSWKKPGIKNYNMIFIPGAFMNDELQKPIDRLSFLRLLLCDDIDNSLKLSEHLASSFTNKLKVPLADINDATYLKKYCMPTHVKGVYARNLSLTRLVKGTVVYGETLYQDNIKECLLLSNNDIEVNGIKTSSRVKQIAEAYFEGIVEYMKQ